MQPPTIIYFTSWKVAEWGDPSGDPWQSRYNTLCKLAMFLVAVMSISFPLFPPPAWNHGVFTKTQRPPMIGDAGPGFLVLSEKRLKSGIIAQSWFLGDFIIQNFKLKENPSKKSVAIFVCKENGMANPSLILYSWLIFIFDRKFPHGWGGDFGCPSIHKQEVSWSQWFFVVLGVMIYWFGGRKLYSWKSNCN